MLPVSDLLIRITTQLTPVVEEFGFTLVDPVDADDTPEQDTVQHDAIQMLSYRKMQSGMPTVLLELCHLSEERWITATLWRPDDLLSRTQVASADEAALRHQNWADDHASDLSSLVGEIVAEIGCWLEQAERNASPPIVTDERRP